MVWYNLTIMNKTKLSCVLAVLCAAASVFATDYYVNTTGGVDDTAEGRGLSPELPYKTIGYALGKAKTSGDHVYVAEGTYQERNLTVAGGVGLIATGRRDYTAIDANASADDNARCIASMAAKAYVKGFTIKNGWVPSSPETNGGGILANANAAIIDCAIRNCRGHRGGGGNGGIWIRCYFAKDNSAGFHAAASGVYGAAFVVNCVFDGAGCVTSSAGKKVMNCTFRDGGYVGTNSQPTCDPNVYNSIVDQFLNGVKLYRTVAFAQSSTTSALHDSADECLFYPDVNVNSPSIAYDSDFMPLLTATDLLKRGNLTSYEEAFPDDWKEIGEWQKAYGGGPRTVDGTIDIGAGECSPWGEKGLVIEKEDLGGGRTRLSISQNQAATRYISGFTFDGEAVSFDANRPGWTWKKVLNDNPEDHELVLAYAFDNCYYVDASRPNDDDSGVGRFHAFRTIRAAMAKVASGGTVRVLPGTYRYTENYAVDSSGVSNVVWFTKANVTLESVQGAKRTIIEGNPATDASGVRCINADQSGAVIRGFTLKNGGAANNGHGGGVYSGTKAVIADCEIRNCHGNRGGGGNGGVWIRCYFASDNVATWNVSAKGVYGPAFVANCVFDGVGCVCDVNGVKVVNCTFCGSSYVGTNDGSKWPLVYNSIVRELQTGAGMYRSVSDKLAGNDSRIKEQGDGCRFSSDVTAASIARDSGFIPLPTATDLVGKGNFESYTNLFPEAWREVGEWQKAYGNTPRTVGETIDIGAGQYSAEVRRLQDLSETLAADGRVTVTEADVDVAATGDGRVSIPADASLKFDWEYPFGNTDAATFAYTVELAPGAKLVFREFGEVAYEITASGTYTFDSLYNHSFDVEAIGGAAILSRLHNTGILKIVDANGRMVIAGAAVGVTEIRPGSSIDVTFSRNDHARPMLKGVLVNGEFRPFNGTAADITQAVTATAGDWIDVEAVYAEHGEWYVDAVNGKDTNDGSTPYLARQTLVEAMKLATKAGDVVHVAPGVYSNGVVRSTGLTSNRVEVASGCGLVADQGPAVTIIEGAYATGDEANDKGLGPNAIRCAYLNGNAWIQGFTLRGGATAVADEYGEQGGGIYGAGSSVATTFALDCIVENCRAVRGGGVNGGTYIRCLMRGNDSVSSMTKDAYNAGGYYGCVFTSGSVYGSIGKIVNCTFVGTSVQGNLGVAHVFNSYVYQDNGSCRYHRCVWSAKKSTTDSTFDDCVQASGAAVALDENYRPLPIATALVDQGLNACYVTNWPAAWSAETDLAGGQRIYNSAIDIGAGEYDWRSEFSRRLGGMRAEVEAATSGVAPGETGVVLADGESLTVDWTARREGTQTFSATVTGEGTLSVLLNGVPLTATDGVYSFEAEADSVSRLEISFAGTGSAEVLKFRGPPIGALLLVR